jgi:hypothetical protein
MRNEGGIDAVLFSDQDYSERTEPVNRHRDKIGVIYKNVPVSRMNR